jgi:hypothetical protein
MQAALLPVTAWLFAAADGKEGFRKGEQRTRSRTGLGSQARGLHLDMQLLARHLEQQNFSAVLSLWCGSISEISSAPGTARRYVQ